MRSVGRGDNQCELGRKDSLEGRSVAKAPGVHPEDLQFAERRFS